MGLKDIATPSYVPYPGGTAPPVGAAAPASSWFDFLSPQLIDYPQPSGSSTTTPPPPVTLKPTVATPAPVAPATPTVVPTVTAPAPVAPATPVAPTVASTAPVEPAPSTPPTVAASRMSAAMRADLPEADDPASTSCARTVTRDDSPGAKPAPVSVTVVFAPYPSSSVALPSSTSTDPGCAPAPCAPQPSAPAPCEPLPNAPAPSAPQPSAPASCEPSLCVSAATAPPSCPGDRVLYTYTVNPRLRARQSRAHEQFLENVLDENISVRMLTKDAAPLTFTTPPGCDSVEFFAGPIEVDPFLGCEGDADEIVTLGSMKIDWAAAPGSLSAGDQINVVVPWRHASWVEMAAGHLRARVSARFYRTATS